MYSQKLTINETLKYIENIENKYYENLSKTGKKTLMNYSLDGNGVLSKKTLYIENGKEWINHEVSVNVNDLSKDVLYDGDKWIRLKCQNKNCFSVYEEGSSYLKIEPYTHYSNDRFWIYVPQEYYAKKVITALNYLFSLLSEKNFERDVNDPFSNSSSAISNLSNVKSNKIKLSEINGTFNINVKFGKINKLFVLDSGASELTISSTLENELLVNKIINEKSYLPDGLYKIADGSIISQKRVLISKIDVGAFSVKNISASIGNKNSPLLLGKNFLDLFKNWSIDNEEKTLELSN